MREKNIYLNECASAILSIIFRFPAFVKKKKKKKAHDNLIFMGFFMSWPSDVFFMFSSVHYGLNTQVASHKGGSLRRKQMNNKTRW